MYRFVAALVGFLGLQLSAVSGFTLPVRARNMRTAVGAADDTSESSTRSADRVRGRESQPFFRRYCTLL